MSLPSGYVKLEYLESDGKQYIDTGFYANNNTRIIVDCLTKSVVDAGTFPFGARTSYVSTAFCPALLPNQLFYNYGNDYKFLSYNGTNKRLLIDSNKNICTFSIEGSIVATIELNTATFKTAYPVYIFSINQAGSVQDGSLWNGPIYSLKWYESDILAHNFIPCKNPYGVVGMWDDVGGKFYQNAGTGVFVAGPEIHEGGIFVKVNSVWKQINNVTVNVR